MPINRGVFAFLAVACVLAAGGGAYLATRQNQVPVPVAADTPVASPAVVETEALIEDLAEPAPAAPPAEGAPAAREPEPRPAPEPVRSRPVERAERPAPPPAPEPAPVPEPVSDPIEDEPVPRVVAAPPLVFAPPVVVSSPPPPPPEPDRIFEELVVSADAVLGLQLDTSVSTEDAEIEDLVEARVTRDVTVGGDVAIPAGSRVQGSVTLVEQGGNVQERARLGIRFHTLVLDDGSRLALSTETLFRDGESPAGDSTAKIGGAAIGGAILGAIFGGAKGASIGGAVGAGAGTAAAMAGGRNPATLPAGSNVTVRILAPVTITVER